MDRHLRQPNVILRSCSILLRFDCPAQMLSEALLCLPGVQGVSAEGMCKLVLIKPLLRRCWIVTRRLDVARHIPDKVLVHVPLAACQVRAGLCCELLPKLASKLCSNDDQLLEVLDGRTGFPLHTDLSQNIAAQADSPELINNKVYMHIFTTNTCTREAA